MFLEINFVYFFLGFTKKTFSGWYKTVIGKGVNNYLYT